MKNILRAVFSLFMILTLTGCGEPDRSRPTVTTILSDQLFDGDIQKDPLTGAFTVTQGNTQSVFAGIDPTSGVESRSFITFHLTGPNGVPGHAIINSAFVELVINSITPQPLIGTIPLRIDLVSFQPPNLIGSDFDRTLQPALATMTLRPPISQADFGGRVPIDVTPLMEEARVWDYWIFSFASWKTLGLLHPG
jgi:hypothetical protein